MNASPGSWSFDETRRLVTARHGEEQEVLLTPCLDSLRARQFYIGHHLANFEQHVVDTLMSAPEGWAPERLLLPTNADEARRNHLLRSRLAAEATACAASLHCLLDTLAHAIAYSLGMNLGPDALTERQISLVNVKRKLAASASGTAVATALATIDQASEVEYLEALVNHSKHRSVIRPGFKFDATADFTSFSIEFESFTFKGQRHAQREVKAALEKAYWTITTWVVDVGRRLNDQLAREAAAA